MFKILKAAIGEPHQRPIPVAFWGEPGTGKTASIEALADEKTAVVTLHLGCKDPTDVGGLPYADITTNTTKYLAPDWFEEICKLDSEGKRTILFLDELGSIMPAVQAAALSLLQERRIGLKKLPSSTAILCAGNPPKSATNAYLLSLAVSNRLLHCEWKVDADAWLDGLIHGWGTKDEESANERALLAGFIHKRKDLLLVPPTQSFDNYAWPSPRSWHNASLAAARAKSLGVDSYDIYAMAVGHGPATEFSEYVDSLDLPDPEEIIKNPTSWNVPNERESYKLYAIMASVFASYKSNMTQSRYNNLWKAVAFVAETHKDIAASFASHLIESAYRKSNWDYPDELRAFEFMGDLRDAS